MGKENSMTTHKELKISGKRKEIMDLFFVLRLNGIESTVPRVNSNKNELTIQCLPSTMLDKILPPWKDSVECKVVTLKN